MAKVYTWEINRAEKKYGYIVNPSDVNIDNPSVYVGDELYGENLEKVINWTSECTVEQYKSQFDKLKQKCSDLGYEVEFEHVDNYLYVKTTCDNLRGPAGRGIREIKTLDHNSSTNMTTLGVYYDDDTFDTFQVPGGENGTNGMNGTDGKDGINGISSKFVMIYKGVGEGETPDRPTGGTYDFITNKMDDTDILRQGWHKDDSTLTGVIYMSSKTFTTSEVLTDEEWTTPVRITGDKGEAGKDGSTMEFIYKISSTKPSVENLPSEQTTNYVPEGWTGSPTGIDEDNTKEWCSIRKYDNEKKEWGQWGEATLWSNYGVNGQDGDGVQYIYYVTKDSTPPKNPTPQNFKNDENYQKQDNEWIPGKNNSYTNVCGETVSFNNDWTDNPSGVTIENKFEWVSSRKYKRNDEDDRKKIWTEFSNPSLWAKFGEDGKSGIGIKKIYALSESTSNIPSINKNDINGGSIWGTGFPTGYVQGTNVVWCSEAEIWGNLNEFVGGYKKVSSVDENNNVIQPTDATAENTQEVDSLPKEQVDNENVKYLKLQSDGHYYIWSYGYCDPYIITGLKGEPGEKGENGQSITGPRGIPGVSQNQLYCLGTNTEYFGVFDDGDKYLLDDMKNRGWFESNEIPNQSINKFDDENSAEETLKKGSVVRISNSEEDTDFYCYWDFENNTYKKLLNFDSEKDFLYIWCIQGNSSNLNNENEYSEINWSSPFKIQGINGLRGNDGKSAQIIYPQGVYNENEVYVTTDKKAPYVMDPQDGQYYVLNKEMAWVGVLPNNYKYITDYVKNNKYVFKTNTVVNLNDLFSTPNSDNFRDPNYDNNTKYVYRLKYTENSIDYCTDWKLSDNGDPVRISKLKYSFDDNFDSNNWYQAKGSGNTPSTSYNNGSNNPDWEKFESFEALYVSVGIIENGTIGSAVYNGDYMFSQQGIDISGGTSSNYEKFRSAYDKTNIESDNPYYSNHEFRPNICINFKTGELWASQGNISFSEGDISLTGNIKRKKLTITKDNIRLYVREENNKKNSRATTPDSGGGTPTPTGTTNTNIGGGVTQSGWTGNTITYLDFDKIGSYVEFCELDKNVEVCLDSLPGNIEYNNDNYDGVRCLLGNSLYILNKSEKIVKINTLARESGDNNNPTLRYIPICENEFMVITCVGGAVNNGERIFWEYSCGKTKDSINVDEEFDRPFDVCVTVSGSSYTC